MDGGRKIVAFPKKQPIFVQGDSSDAVFYMQKGKVKLSVVSRTGKEATISILNEGDFFGEGCLTGQPLRLCSATAMTDCSVMRIEKTLHDGSASSGTRVFRYVRGIFADPEHPIRRGFG
jgi:CRP/FNR family cyclic AMP-dependent transcriptional regulator